jgi:ADP-heptose:LPS heptosyltransferase
MTRTRIALLKWADATIGRLLCRILGARPPHPAEPETPTVPRPETVRRILVVRPGGMGDMVLLLPALRRMRDAFPQARMDLLCEQRNLQVAALAGPGIRVLAYDRTPLRCLAAIRRRPYDLAVDTEQFHHFSAVLCRLSRAPLRVGFSVNPRRNGLYTRMEPYAPDGPEGEQFANLLRPIGIPGEVPPLRGFLSDAALEPPAGIAPGLAALEPFAAVHVGASSRFKQWPTDSFGQLIRLLNDRLGLGVALAGSAADRRRSRQIALSAALPPQRLLSLAGATDLAGAAAVIRKARLFVGGDSGLAHLAVALGVPTVVLFGPSDPRKWGVEGPRNAVVWKRIACAPCFRFGCRAPCRRAACMEAIAVEDVMEAAVRVFPR